MTEMHLVFALWHLKYSDVIKIHLQAVRLGMGFLIWELGFGPKLAWELGFGPKLGWDLGFGTPHPPPPPSGPSIYWDKFVREVNGNNAIHYFVKHKQPVVSSTLEETTFNITCYYSISLKMTQMFQSLSDGQTSRN